jgi:hypothetical protein
MYQSGREPDLSILQRCLERRPPNQIQAILCQQESGARIGICRLLADLPYLEDAVIAGRFPALKNLIVSRALANGCVEGRASEP